MKRMLRSSPQTHIQVRHSTRFAIIFLGGIALASMLMTLARAHQQSNPAALSQTEISLP